MHKINEKYIRKGALLPFNPAKVPFFYGWAIVALGTLGMLMSTPGQTTGVATYTDYLIEALGLTRSQLSLAYMLGTISSSFLLTWAGKMFDRFGARIVAASTTVGLALVLLFFSQSDHVAGAFAATTGLDPMWTAFGTIFFGFFALRFTGQGVLAMTSRNMTMKWFVQRRGLANAIGGVFVTLGFSVAPLVFDEIIQGMGWRTSYIFMAAILAIPFLAIILIFFRDNPEECGMVPDGGLHGEKKTDKTFEPEKQYTLKEARRTYAYWIYAISLAMFSLTMTGFTFHVVSVFEEVGLDRSTALSIFLPSSIIGVFITTFSSWVSDRIRLKYLLMLLTAGGVLSSIGMIFLAEGIPMYILILGNAIITSLFAVLNSLVWPRYYGRQHLGAISGSAMSMMVFFSAIGPWLFSLSQTLVGSYMLSYIVCGVLWALLLLGSFKARNPQFTK